MNTGKTYTLSDHEGNSGAYFRTIRELADAAVAEHGHLRVALEKVQRESDPGGLLKRLLRRGGAGGTLAGQLAEALTPFMEDVEGHLASLGIQERLDPTVSANVSQYHLYMVEIELANRLNGEAFRKAPWRMALLAHCLRDTRDHCRMEYGVIEAVCTHCDDSCYVNLGSVLLEKYGVEPYISVRMDHPGLFRELKAAHPRMGVLGVACVPELVFGMRLCAKLEIPAVGVPLDMNRCGRWFDECLDSSFSLDELERLVGDQ
jgi:hypothetical protein